jgi:branched-chain amino acid transport system ATP-binding protein
MLMSLKQLEERGITILLVSQEVVQSLQLSRRAYVLDNGRIALEGSGAELSQNEHIRKAYLGM